MHFIQKVSGIFPIKKLYGVEANVEKPSFSAASWFNGQYARDFELYFTAKIGFRSLAIRTLNQIRFELFRDVSREQGTQIIIGKDNWLFEKGYADRLISISDLAMSESQLIRFSELLSQVQSKLTEKGIAFSLVISPSKAEIYREKLPENILAQLPEEEILTNRKRLIPYLQKKRVHYLDVHDFFLKIKPNSDILFAPGGTHWNFYGSFLACRELIQILNNKTNITLPIPNLESIQHRQALGADKDLADLLNLLSYQSNKSFIPYPNVIVDALPMDKRLNVLVVGDSFAWTLISSMGTSQMARHIDFMYYNKRLFSYSSPEERGVTINHTAAEIGPINHARFDWERILADKELVVLEISEIQLYKVSWGFLKTLGKHLGIQNKTAILNKTQISQLYVFIFGRASEGDGNLYWRTHPNSIDMVATADMMLNTVDAKNNFGLSLNDNLSFIKHIYFKTFGKTFEDDSEGIEYWAAQLDAEKTKGKIITDIILAVQDPANVGADQNRFNHRVMISNYCADMIAPFLDFVTLSGFINNVTDDPKTVAFSKELIKAKSKSIDTQKDNHNERSIQ